MRVILDQSLAQRLRDVSLPTLGHYLEAGFASYALRALVPNVKVVGRAVTLQLHSPDAIAVNRALAQLTPGDVLVIDMQGDHEHACVGAVTATAAQCAGAEGIVINGVATDLLELRQIGLPVFALGTSALTTKRLDDNTSGFNVPVQCGGVTVAPGAIVIADDNGVLVSDAESLLMIIDAALASDRAEPGILARLRAGEQVRDILVCTTPKTIRASNADH
ncbi:RraA family protein [Paraburkholderia sp. J8-2]|uniref:RraA family protein n=1 Tax=Paraburkholderia sp. J8-2 TaxID=2805440 RepID=UPI002AB68B92|nr:RraA family protein [Paraburkholderia sp. J8-2]